MHAYLPPSPASRIISSASRTAVSSLYQNWLIRLEDNYSGNSQILHFISQ